MKKLLPLFILILGTQLNAKDIPNIVIFGDSLSAGYGIDIEQSWVSLLQTKLTNNNYNYKVINASISGETTEGGKNRIKNILNNFQPNLIIIELGGNDGLRGFPPNLIKNNLKEIIQASRLKNTSIILLGIRIPPNYGVRYTKAFENVYSDLATELDIPWVEFFMKDVALVKELMQEDQIHPNAEAQPILLGNVWPIIMKTL